LELTPDTDSTVRILRAKRDVLARQVAEPIEFPEGALRLNLAKRAPDERRMYMHLHQSCLSHSLGFNTANRIKLVYLLDAYLQMLDSANPIGIYSAARGVLEFNAFTYEVSRRLLVVKADTGRHWIPKGEEFFGIIVRAKFGTSNPAAAEILVKDGLSKKHLKPFSIMESIKALAHEKEFADAPAQYDKLCDHVHHNLSSHIAMSSGFVISQTARSARGGMILMPTKGPIVRFEYPAPAKASRAIEESAPYALTSAVATVQWINRCPESPYELDEIKRMTGYEFGVKSIQPRSQKRNISTPPQMVGRNDPCPCGSGKKFKRCCLQ
jgi:SEC-C motif-containing protein